jgi:hypothetical protein
MAASSTTEATLSLPCSAALQHAAQKALEEDRPVIFDYWAGSLSGHVVIGIRDSGEKLLVKSAEEYTSPIAKIYKVETDFLVMTENSLYIVHGAVQTRKVA